MSGAGLSETSASLKSGVLGASRPLKAPSWRGAARGLFPSHLHEGGSTYIQYWLYYPDSNTTLAGSDKLFKYSPPGVRVISRLLTGKWRYPGFHNDDWEGYQVRIDADGDTSVRATAHHGYQWCKQRQCHNQWGDWTGWTRVSRGSHAGHIPMERHGWREHTYTPSYPGVDVDERTTTAAGLQLVPIEPLAGRGDTFDEIAPPWQKDVYRDPRSNSTGGGAGSFFTAGALSSSSRKRISSALEALLASSIGKCPQRG